MDPEAPASFPPQKANEGNQQAVENALVEKETVKVARWNPDRMMTGLQSKSPNVDFWLVDCTIEKESTGKRKKIWARAGLGQSVYEKFHETLGIEPDGTARGMAGGFVKGQAYRGTTTLCTASGKDRPEFVFRVTHEGTRDGSIKAMPFGGLKARGYGRIRTDAIHFQDLVQRHLNPNSRAQGPFISVGRYMDRALFYCEFYIKKGCQGIKIHRIKTSGDAWNHKEQRMFSVQHLVIQFDLRTGMREAFRDDYLIENEIPTACIVETVDPWDFPASWVTRMPDISLAVHPRTWNFRTMERSLGRIRRMKEDAHRLQQQHLALDAEEENSRMGDGGSGEDIEDAMEEDSDSEDQDSQDQDSEAQDSEDGEKPDNRSNTRDAIRLDGNPKSEGVTKPTQGMRTTQVTEASEPTQSSKHIGTSGRTNSQEDTDLEEDDDISEYQYRDKEKKKRRSRTRCVGFQRVKWKKKA